jgi:hypothetical protein
LMWHPGGTLSLSCLPQMPPPPSLDKLCENHHIPAPPNLDRPAHTGINAAVLSSASASANKLHIPCAGTSPVTSQVNHISDLARLAKAVALFMPDEPAAPVMPPVPLQTPPPGDPRGSLPCPSHSRHLHRCRPAPGISSAAPSGIPSCTLPVPLASSLSRLPIRLHHSHSPAPAPPLRGRAIPLPRKTTRTLGPHLSTHPCCLTCGSPLQVRCR